MRGEEIVKFLTDVFDALFSILVDPVDPIITELRSGRASMLGNMDPNELRLYEVDSEGPCDRPVFDCLVRPVLINLVMFVIVHIVFLLSFKIDFVFILLVDLYFWIDP